MGRSHPINNEGNNRMADEQATVAEVTAPEETLEQTPEVSTEPVQDTPTPEVPETPAEPDRGDPRIAMQDERRKRQELEANSNNPQWIYEQAKRLGLAADETPSSPQSFPTQPASTPTAPDIASIVEHQLEYREAIKEHPELESNEGLRIWAAGLVDRGHSPKQAADIIFKTIDKQAGKSATSQVDSALKAQSESEAAKLSADAITSTTTEKPADAETEALNSRAHNWKEPKDQEQAILEKFKRRMN